MWYFKTQCGIFWIVSSDEGEEKFFLGINDDALGVYSHHESAVSDINNHTTGYYLWDTQKMNVPHSLEAWGHGEPDWATVHR